MKIVVTNNPLVSLKISDTEIDFRNTDLLGVLKCVRDRIHLGHKLLTHPLAGSIKPWETPYRTVLLTAEKSGLDEDSLSVIEYCIEMCNKTIVSKAFYYKRDEKNLSDFQLIDFDLIFGRFS
ncbi:MAG: GrdX family protein [Candidatus Cloacimonetes bacterium]|nr:GrdX family protein [Candidatus Cloacimonadota bacterium]